MRTGSVFWAKPSGCDAGRVGKLVLCLRISLIAAVGLVAVHAMARAARADEASPGTIKLELGPIDAVAKSVTGWFEGGIRSLGRAQPVARRGECDSGLGPGCTYIDRWWFGNRPDEHYEGAFHDGMPDGRGVYRWSNGSRYEGGFRDGRFDGRGAFTWSNGYSYVGEWEDGRPNGAGTFVTARGTFKGLWVDGCLQSGRDWVAVGNDARSCRLMEKARQSDPIRYRAVLEKRAAQRQLSALVGCVATEQKPDAPCGLNAPPPKRGTAAHDR